MYSYYWALNDHGGSNLNLSAICEDVLDGNVSLARSLPVQDKKTQNKMATEPSFQRELNVDLCKNCPAIDKRRRVGYIQASWLTNCKLEYYEKAR